MKILANRNSVQGIVTYYTGLSGFVGSCIGIANGVGAWALAGFLLSLTMTVLQDVHWFRRRRAHPHDIQLVEKLTELFQETGTDLFLRQHDFESHAFDDSQLAPLHRIQQDWLGVDYEFVNQEFGTHWCALRERLLELTTILTGEGLIPGANFYHLAPMAKKPEAGFEKRIEQARYANQLARQAFDDFQEIRRLYIRYKQLLDIRT